MSLTPTTEFPKLLDLAMAEVQQSTHELFTEHGLDQFAEWQCDDVNGALIFRNPGVDQLAVPYQLIGSHHPAESLWRWAWDDYTVNANYTRSAITARNWGLAQGIDLLTAPTTFADATLAWKLTAFAARLTGCPGIYRGQVGNRILHFAFAVFIP